MTVGNSRLLLLLLFGLAVVVVVLVVDITTASRLVSDVGSGRNDDIGPAVVLLYNNVENNPMLQFDLILEL